MRCPKIATNGPGIATVADLRASSLSHATKAHAEQRTQNYHQAPLLLAIPCWRVVFYLVSSSINAIGQHFIVSVVKVFLNSSLSHSIS